MPDRFILQFFCKDVTWGHIKRRIGSRTGRGSLRTRIQSVEVRDIFHDAAALQVLPHLREGHMELHLSRPGEGKKYIRPSDIQSDRYLSGGVKGE